MRTLRPFVFYPILILLVALPAALRAQTGGGSVVAKTVLDGSLHQIQPDSSRTVVDSAFFTYLPLHTVDTNYTVQNMVTLKINEASNVFLRDSFTVTVMMRIGYTTGSQDTSGVIVPFVIHYDSAHAYTARSTFVFKGAHKVTVTVLSVTSSVSATWDATAALLIENQLTATPDFVFGCSNTVWTVSVNPSSIAVTDELPVSWTAVLGADQYDLEWTFVDNSALALHRYGTIRAGNQADSIAFADTIFQNNATRVTTTGTSYNIPLIYDDTSTLFIRVRPVQVKPGNMVYNAEWSSDAQPTTGLGSYVFDSHQPNLNWQANISYAEQGKRKVVVQYYDGSLRSRQTVTKDNTTDTTIVAETLYDYQGRPAIQVMPAPSLSNTIQYIAGFNVAADGSEYTQTHYDTLTNPTTYCTAHADGMGTQSGASMYYSGNNPKKGYGLNQFIPDAQTYPFSQTEYTPDNTGRISRQGGVGPEYQLGSLHETKYYYGSPDQGELDALFGTEVGDHSHYFKNSVRDANGQYSISYVDMHGRTIATALAGPAPAGMAALPSNLGRAVVTDNLADSGSLIIRDGSIINQKSLVVTSRDTFNFSYSLTPPQISQANCASATICYTCRYDIEVTISDDCNNQNFGGQPFDTVVRNFTPGFITTNCTDSVKAFTFSKVLGEGSYQITKKLTVDKDAYTWYRDSIYLPNNTCISLGQYIQNQKTLIASQNTACVPTCQACLDSVGTWTSFWSKYMTELAVPTADTPSYRSEAWAAYNNAVTSCNALCQTNQLQQDAIISGMLQDVTPPYGQYADTLPTRINDLYNIFYQQPNNINYVAAYRTDSLVYFDSEGRPDSVYSPSAQMLVPPNKLSRVEFVQNFKPSWANTLLQFHPEYCKLQALEGFATSQAWDEMVNGINTYAAANALGLLNPTNSTDSRIEPVFGANPSNTDPFTAGNSNYQRIMQGKEFTYVSTGGVPTMSMWGLACANAHCKSPLTTACLDSFDVAHFSDDFNASIMCTSELDIAWTNFRTYYMGYKQDMFNEFVYNGAHCAGYHNPMNPGTPSSGKLLSLHYIPEFSDYAVGDPSTNSIIAQNGLNGINSYGGSGTMTADTANVGDSLRSYYIRQAYGYAYAWASQLSPCQYDSVSLKDTILPRLIGLCIAASDDTHPFGASTMPTGLYYTPLGTSYRFSSFQDILNTFNALHTNHAGLPYCNAELITAPLPYTTTAIYSTVPVIRQPSSCQCTLINQYYALYQAAPQGAASFSAYLQQTQQISMTDADLSELRGACNGTTGGNCNFLTHVIQLPPAFQCNSGTVCATCGIVDTLYSQYKAQYPSYLPAISDSVDTAQATKNLLFQNFMNNRLGYGLQTWQYLQFIDSCSIYDSLYGALHCSSLSLGHAYHSADSAAFYSITGTPDNGYIMAGRIYGVDFAAWEAYLVKTDKAGNLQWARAFGHTGNSYFARAKAVSDGYITIGSTPSDSSGLNQELICKYSFSGSLLWVKTIGFGTASGENGWDIIQTSDGGYATAGTYNDAPGTGDILVSKLDSSGNQVWNEHFGTVNGGVPNSDIGKDIFEQGDTLIVIGSTYSGEWDPTIYKLNEGSGSILGSAAAGYTQSGRSLWPGPAYQTANGYRIFLDNTDAGATTHQQIAFFDITRNNTAIDFVEANVPPGNNVATTAGIVPTSDGGAMVAQCGDVTKHIYLTKVSGANTATSNSMITLTGYQAVGGVFQNADTTYGLAGSTNDTSAVFMTLNSSGQAGCKDSALTVGVTTPEIDDESFTTLATAFVFNSNDQPVSHYYTSSVTPADSLISCSQSPLCGSLAIPPTLCGKAQPIFGPASQDSTTTCTDSTFFAVSKGTGLYNTYSDSLTGDFEHRYDSVCMRAYRFETFTATHHDNQYHYTLYYYDQAGNLIKTVPPAGVNPAFRTTWTDSVDAARAAGQILVPTHSLTTSYRYNTLNQVISQHSPDGGQSGFWYDRLGRLAVSQNARQLPNSQYSYTQYDSIGRIVEVGQLTNSTAVTNGTSRNDSLLNLWITGVASSKEQVTQTAYDFAYSPIAPALAAQNLRNRVAYTGIYGTEADITSTTPTEAAITYYSYDILGNVDTLLHEYRSGNMTTASNRLKKIVYDYDLQSGKVDKVSYQHGYDDQFYHLYTYDAENRLTNVQTSADSLNWDNDAFYAYYLHGPLSRSVLGEQQVQGINYAYTLQGWMKGVNPAIASGSGFSIQPDGASGSPIASNAYNLQLNYHYHDFIPISGVTPPDEGINTTMASDSTNLFNGNIASMGVKIAALGHPLLYNYHYDQLNRLVNMDAYNNTGTTWASSSSIQDFKENVAYDPNGNILTYNRNGNQTFAGTGLNMDQLTYYYKPNTNQLDHINDAVSASAYPNDIDAQSSGNYSYDAIGELVGDNASNISNITWTAYGKIKSIAKPHQSPSTVDTTISFTYDASGNRISKTETAGSSVTTTWYVRDAQGNPLAIYAASSSVKGGDLILSERDLYGSKRLGLARSAIDVAADSVPVVTSLPLLGWGNPGIFVRGNKLFELSNHLGNVLATISDRHYGISSDGSTVDHFNPVVLDANDYYPFGSLEPGRTYDASGAYRYGFNGKENDNEVKGVGDEQDYGMRIYDPRVGRFLSVDPITDKYPALTPYQFASNTPLWGIDQDGLELAKMWDNFTTYVEFSSYLMGGRDAAEATHKALHGNIAAAKRLGNSIASIPAQTKQMASDAYDDVKAHVNNYNRASPQRKLQMWSNAFQDAALNISIMGLTDGVMSGDIFYKPTELPYTPPENDVIIQDPAPLNSPTPPAEIETTPKIDNEALYQKYKKNRPHLSQSTIQKAWDAAKDEEGIVRDPNTDEELTWDKFKSRYDQWHMGHKPGSEYRTLLQKLRKGEITEAEFKKEYNDPKNYQPESPGANMSHRYEQKTTTQTQTQTGG